MKKKISIKFVFNFILIIFLAILFGYLCFSDNGLIDLIKNSKGFNKTWLTMSFLCQIINLFIDIYLVYKFTNNMDEKYTIKKAIRSAMIGQFFSAITPGASGGQPMQVYAMAKQGVDSGISTSALVQKFLVYQTVLTFYSMMAILIRIDYFNSLNKIVWSIAITGFIMQAIVIAAILLFSFNKKITSKIISLVFILLGKLHILKKVDEKIVSINKQLVLFHDGNKALYQNKSMFLRTYVLTAIQLTATFLIPYCIYRAFDLYGESMISMICAQSFITMTSSLAPIPGASGATEGASSIFFSPFFDETTIKSAIALSRFITYYFTILISLPFSRFVKNKKGN